MTREVLPALLLGVVIALLRGLILSEIAARDRRNPVTIRTRILRARALLRGELRA